MRDRVSNHVGARENARRHQARARAGAAEGAAWFGGTLWQGKAAMRVSVSNWSTRATDIDRAADAVVACYREVR